VVTKVSTMCGVRHVVLNHDVPSVYAVPAVFMRQGVLSAVTGMADSEHRKLPDLAAYARVAGLLEAPTVSVAIVGKYNREEDEPDTYLSVQRALEHAGVHHGVGVRCVWINVENAAGLGPSDVAAAGCVGVVVPGGFGVRGVEALVNTSAKCYTGRVPTLGICLGFQVMAIALRRLTSKPGVSQEFDPHVPSAHHVVRLGTHQVDGSDVGGTLRKGLKHFKVSDATAGVFGLDSTTFSQRVRHRYEVVPDVVADMKTDVPTVHWDGFSDDVPDVPNVLWADDRPFFGVQSHPELTSTLEFPSPLFFKFVACAIGE
ncbi:MAG: hypothetical protein VX902_00255, partial [Planctomycetota bacterium]|nr:hypothetical protein [Planctomycetota bacterium]